MTLHVLRSGPLATLQAGARSGLRHFGVPASGPADPLSMALANRLVGNTCDEVALEITLGGAAFRFGSQVRFALAGAVGGATLAGENVPAHKTLEARKGDELFVGQAQAGVRMYLAVTGGFEAEEFLGSKSTCLPAAVGGLHGRALKAGDELVALGNLQGDILETPQYLRPFLSHSHAVRAVAGPDFGSLGEEIWTRTFSATRRMDRTGIEIDGALPASKGSSLKPSAAVFPGTVQLTPAGQAFILMPDGQTTGGYPHVLQVIRADRHLLGQIGPTDTIRFLKRTPEQAHAELLTKTQLFSDWLPGFRF